MQQQPATNFKSFLRTISIIHFFLMAGLIMIIILFISSGELGVLSFTQQPFEFLIPALLISGVFIGTYISKMMLTKETQNKTLQQKLGVYQTAHIIRVALVEGIGFFAAITYSNTNNLFFLLIAGIAILIMFTRIQTKEKIESALPISSEDQVYLKNPDKAFRS